MLLSVHGVGSAVFTCVFNHFSVSCTNQMDQTGIRLRLGVAFGLGVKI